MEQRTDSESRVLLVDDDDGLLIVLKRALRTHGLDVTAAGTGAAALAALAAGSFDAMITDLQMPGMSGLKLLRAVRQHDLDLPVVLITGQPDLKTAAAAVEYGAFQYLIKPVEVERLRAVVERAINVGRLARLKRECAEGFGSGSFYVGDRAGIDAKLTQALHSLWMAYQPIVHAATGEVYAYEALLRSEEPLLPHPGMVLKAAERVGRVHDVGRAVRERVAADSSLVASQNAFLFINLHPDDLLDPSLYLPSAALTRVAARVVLELTDRASLERVSDVEERVERLRALGFRIAIDDLGAGQAGLATFAHLEPEFVKLDISVVRGVDHDPTKKKVVNSLVRLCHNMGKAVIAEGVENALERDTLQEAGCDFLQGYFFGRPAPFLDHENSRRSGAA